MDLLLLFSFSFFSSLEESESGGQTLFETLNLFHAYLFYDSAGHCVYTQSATSGLDNLLGINQTHMLINLI